MFGSHGNCEIGEEFLEKSLAIFREIGDEEGELKILLNCAQLNMSKNKLPDAFMYLRQCTQVFEEVRGSLGVNDQFKTSFLEESGAFPYEMLSTLLSTSGNFRDALYVEELGRARCISELMAEKYSIGTHISANP